jgi:hypothetical protein
MILPSIKSNTSKQNGGMTTTEKRRKDAYGTNDRQTKYPPRIAFQSHIESDIPFSIHIAIKSPVVFPHLEIRHLQSHVFKRKLEPGKRADVFVQ